MTLETDLVHETPISQATGGKDWLTHFLREGENVTQFKQRLKRMGWEPGQMDTHGSTLTGALLWKALVMRSARKQKNALGHVLRALAWVSPREASFLPMVDLWWAAVFCDTAFVRYPERGASYSKAKTALQGREATKKNGDEVNVLSRVLDQALSRRPLEEWGWEYPEKALWGRVRNLSLEFLGEESIEPILTLLCHPVVAHLAQSAPSGLWEWSWWMREDPQAWEQVLKNPKAWEALERTRVGSQMGRAERLRENARILSGIGKGLKLRPDKQQELEKLCTALTFLQGLKIFWTQHHLANTWTEGLASRPSRL